MRNLYYNFNRKSDFTCLARICPENFFSLFVSIDFPAYIVFEGFGDCIGFFGSADVNMMLIAHFTDILQKKLQVRNLRDTVAAESLQLVVSEIALPDISANDARRIVGSGSAEGGPCPGADSNGDRYTR